MGRLLLVLALMVGCTEGEGPRDGPRRSSEDALLVDLSPPRPDASAVDRGIPDAQADAVVEPDAGTPDAGLADSGPRRDADVPDAVPPCDRPPPLGLSAVEQGAYRASVTVEGDACQRTFRLATNQPLREGEPVNPRVIDEAAPGPILRTASPLLDALYRLAVVEAAENAVVSIRDGAFSNGMPIPCPPGGCYETGRLWHYVWTRDTAYATALGLALLDPQRVRNSLEFKLSEPSGGGPEQIMQDTGTGGSHPISTDRVIWALGARTLLTQLRGDAQLAFARRALAAMRATALHDRVVAYDPEDGLYRGEQSFLDWREQSYPEWTADALAHIGMSKSLSTNIAHLILLELLGNIADDLVESREWLARAEVLRGTIRARFWLPEAGLFSAFITTTLDPAPARQFDLLGNALAILEGVATPEQAAAITRSYPHLPAGPPVIWPQQQEVPIYHNRAQWPFVTAFWVLAARSAANPDAQAAGAMAMIRTAALNLSHMENVEALSGLPYVEEGRTSGPVVNSQRQLWSVAGFLALVHEGLFGLQPRNDRLIIAPRMSMALWTTLFGNADRAVLEGYPYRGQRLTVVMGRPRRDARPEGITLPAGFDTQRLEVTALELPSDPNGVTQVVEADYRAQFAPRPPFVSGIEAQADGLRVHFDPNGEVAQLVVAAVYRDGERIAEEIPMDGRSWLDASARADGPSHCYTLETRFRDWPHWSQRAAPACWWGPDADRILNFGAARLTPVGGQRSNDHGRPHIEVWADVGQGLALDAVEVPNAGRWLIQAVYSNGAASGTTGVTCGLLRVRVEEEESGREVGRGYLPLPHTWAWDAWRDSAFVPVDLVAGVRYRVLLDGQEEAYNMSKFQHFRRYTGGLGGAEGVFNRANISAIKLLRR